LVICGFSSAFGSAFYTLFNPQTAGPQIRIIPVAMADIRFCANGWFNLTRKFVFKEPSPTNHFCTNR